MKAHGTQTRASGDPYFSHSAEVAAILTDSSSTTHHVAALLHDTIEDTSYPRRNRSRLRTNRRLVEGPHQLNGWTVSARAKQAENLRKLLLGDRRRTSAFFLISLPTPCTTCVRWNS